MIMQGVPTAGAGAFAQELFGQLGNERAQRLALQQDVLTQPARDRTQVNDILELLLKKKHGVLMGGGGGAGSAGASLMDTIGTGANIGFGVYDRYKSHSQNLPEGFKQNEIWSGSAGGMPMSTGAGFPGP